MAGGKLARKARFEEPVDALEVVDVALIAQLFQEGALAVDRRAVGDVTLTEYARVRLCQVLATLDWSVVL